MTAVAPARGRRLGDDPGIRRRLRIFVGVAVVVLVVIAIGTVLIARLVAQQEALRDAERTTTRLATLVVAPLLGEALAGNAQRRDELDRAVQIRLGDGTIDELTVWRADGTVVYANESGIIGRTVPLPSEARAAIERGAISSAIEFADETGDLPAGERFVEVYAPLRIPGQPTYAFEAYFNVQRVDDRAAALSTQLILLALVPLILLQLVQIPIALSLARRLAAREAQRAALLERALSASDRERRAIASDLHDGVVQNLAGVSYAMGALRSSLPPERRAVADTCSGSVRDAVESLRRLMVDIYPPDLSGSGLTAAVDGLAEPLRAAGTAVTVEASSLPALDPDIAAAVYRVARESLTNVAKHAGAGTVRIELGTAGAGDAGDVRLRITDDGVGLAPNALEHRADGHFGLHMMIDRVADLGGRFTVTAAAGGGTVAEAVLPARPAS